MTMTEFHSPICLRCCGTGIDPDIDEIVCWRCSGSGDGVETEWQPVGIPGMVLRFLYLPDRFRE